MNESVKIFGAGGLLFVLLILPGVIPFWTLNLSVILAIVIGLAVYVLEGRAEASE